MLTREPCHTCQSWSYLFILDTSKIVVEEILGSKQHAHTYNLLKFKSFTRFSHNIYLGKFTNCLEHNRSDFQRNFESKNINTICHNEAQLLACCSAKGRGIG